MALRAPLPPRIISAPPVLTPAPPMITMPHAFPGAAPRVAPGPLTPIAHGGMRAGPVQVGTPTVIGGPTLAPGPLTPITHGGNAAGVSQFGAPTIIQAPLPAPGGVGFNNTIHPIRRGSGTTPAIPTLFPASHSGALSNANGAELGAALRINATQWHETPPSVPVLAQRAHKMDLSMNHLLKQPVIDAPHGLAPKHQIVTGNLEGEHLTHFNPYTL